MRGLHLVLNLISGYLIPGRPGIAVLAALMIERLIARDRAATTGPEAFQIRQNRV